MKKPTCETCVHWECKKPREEYGRCQRYPKPQQTGHLYGCGEHPDFPTWMAEEKGLKTGEFEILAHQVTGGEVVDVGKYMQDLKDDGYEIAIKKK